MTFSEKYPNTELRALSWKQPYGTLMLPPFNKVETRTWDTKYRGWVLICTSKSGYTLTEVRKISGKRQSNRIVEARICSELPLLHGKAIGIGYLHKTRLMADMREDMVLAYNDEEKTYVKYADGRFMHFYRDVQPIQPIEWKGSQGWRTVSEDIKNQIILL